MATIHDVGYATNQEFLVGAPPTTEIRFGTESYTWIKSSVTDEWIHSRDGNSLVGSYNGYSYWDTNDWPITVETYPSNHEQEETLLEKNIKAVFNAYAEMLDFTPDMWARISAEDLHKQWLQDVLECLEDTNNGKEWED